MTASFTGAFPHRLLQRRPQHPHHHLDFKSALHTTSHLSTQRYTILETMPGCRSSGVTPTFGRGRAVRPRSVSPLFRLTGVSRLNVKSSSAATAHAVSDSNYSNPALGLTAYTGDRKDVITQRLHPWILYPSLVSNPPHSHGTSPC